MRVGIPEGTACWNGLTPGQREDLTVTGHLRGLHPGESDAGLCGRQAEVAVETTTDRAPGPRFYCPACVTVTEWGSR